MGLLLSRPMDETLDVALKFEEIEACLDKETVDLWELRELALTRGGFLKGRIRRRAWTKLVGLSDDGAVDDEESDDGGVFREKRNADAGEIPAIQESKSKDEELEVDLIRRDVGRSVLFRYQPAAAEKGAADGDDLSIATPGGQSSRETSSVSPAQGTPSYAAERLADVLEKAITRPINSGKIHYYQGLHDVAGVLLHNMNYDTKSTTNIVRRVCQSHLRDALRENFGNITWMLHAMLLPLIEQVDVHVHYALVVSGVELSNVCLPWMITWFTHDIHNHLVAARFADAFIASHPLLPLYVAVALMTHPILKQKILASDCDDPASMFMVLKSLPFSISSDTAQRREGRMLVQEFIEDAISIMRVIPPRRLLELVDPDMYPRQTVLERVSSVSMFKAPSSWSMAALYPSSNGVTAATRSGQHVVRAKLASGVPILMKSVDSIAVTLGRSPTWGSQPHIESRKRAKRISKLMYIAQIFLPSKAVALRALSFLGLHEDDLIPR